jgi:hypothetical protein
MFADFNLTPEQQRELSLFPPVLRELLRAELAAGNRIVEIGHSFPAPPVGAYVKLANPISTRARASGDGIDFYERNSSIYSGEITDAKRFYFVLEPPNPPPPEPDMDAIRAALAPKPDPLLLLAERKPGEHVEPMVRDLVQRSFGAESTDRDVPRDPVPPPRALTSIETGTGSSRLLHFRDRRPPHEVQFALERDLMVLFAVMPDDHLLRLSAHAQVIGAPYVFEVRFEAALPEVNCYSLRVDTSWAHQPATHIDYYRSTSDSWFRHWTRDLMMATPTDPAENLPERYRELRDAALQAEAHLDSVAAIQRDIVSAMQRGGTYATSHKEGGTTIYWRHGVFIRSDYGDDPDHINYRDEEEFLQKLRQFCEWDVTRHAGAEKYTDLETWKLIRRRLVIRS